MKKLIVIFVSIISFLTVGCCQQEILPDHIAEIFNENVNKVYRVGIYGDIEHLHPLMPIEDQNTQMLLNLVHASPLRKLDDGTFEPYLFEEGYYLTRDSAGRVILEAVWRPGLKWHDGTDFDARDLEFTLDMIRKAEEKHPLSKLVEGISSINTIGMGNSRRTRIVFKNDSRQYLELLTVGILPSHILKDQDLYEARIEKEGQASDTWPLYSTQPVGLGPYKVAERVRGSYTFLTSFDEFFDKIDRPDLLIKSEYDIQQLISDFRSGLYEWVGIPSMIAAQLESMRLDNVSFVRYPNPAILSWIFNTNSSKLSDAGVRRALDLVVNRDSLRRQIPYDGRALYSMPGFESSEPDNIADRLKLAAELLDEAGWTMTDRVRKKDGKKLEISISFNSDNILRKTVAESIISDLSKIGVRASKDEVSWSELLSDRLKPGDFDTAILSYRLAEGTNHKSIFYSSLKDEDNLNFSGISCVELDSALTKLDSIFPDTKTSAPKELLKNTLFEQRPVAFLFQPHDVALLPRAQESYVASATIWNAVLDWPVMFGHDN